MSRPPSKDWTSRLPKADFVQVHKKGNAPAKSPYPKPGIRLIDPNAPFRIFLLASRLRLTHGEQAGGQMIGNVMW